MLGELTTQRYYALTIMLNTAPPAPSYKNDLSRLRLLAQKPVWEGFETMLRIFAVTLLAIALPVGFAQAKHIEACAQAYESDEHVQTNAIPLKNAIPMCVEGQQVTATCACGTEASGHPFMCEQGQWCRTFAHACTR